MVTWEEVRQLALALPEVEESTSFGSPCFRVRGRPFAEVSRHEGAVWTRCDREERPLLVASDPDAYRLTPHFERSPAHLLIWLEHVRHEELRERLVDAWLLVAPKRLAVAAADRLE
jgi:hypothetical protein